MAIRAATLRATSTVVVVSGDKLPACKSRFNHLPILISVYGFYNFSTLNWIEKISIVVTLPIILGLTIGVYEKLKKSKEDIDKRFEYHFKKPNSFQYLEENVAITESQIKKVNLNWQKFVDVKFNILEVK